MKNKRLTVFLLTTMIMACVYAQTKEFNYQIKGSPEEVTLYITNMYSDLIIEGYSGDELVISTDDYHGLPEEAKGLKPLGAAGPENTGLGLTLSQEGNKVNLSAAYREADRTDYVIKIPTSMNINIDYNNWKAEDVIIRNVEGNVEIKNQVGEIRLENVTGPIVAHTLSDDIKVVFSDLNQLSPSSITSVSGDIDITLQSSTKGTFDMNSVSGGIYTDLDFELSGDSKPSLNQRATGNLNGGGVKVLIKSVSGNIYLRKSE